MNNRTREILTAARAKVSQGWCRGANARDTEGRPCQIASPDAVQWCVAGSVYAALDPNGEHSDALALIRQHIPTGGLWDIQQWNDAEERTPAEVLDLFDRVLGECPAVAS